jgi:hypothetical protein
MPPRCVPRGCLTHALQINVEFPKLQRQIATDNKVDGFIDIWTPLLKVSGGLNATFGGTVAGEPLTCDGCHPKDAGLTIMAQTIADRIRV